MQNYSKMSTEKKVKIKKVKRIDPNKTSIHIPRIDGHWLVSECRKIPDYDTMTVDRLWRELIKVIILNYFDIF